MRWWPVLLAALTFPASAAWTEGETSDGDLYAATTNDDGQVLAQFCTVADATCQWVLVTQDTCEVGKTRTPTLISAPAGATSATMACLSTTPSGGKTLYRLGFYPFDSVDAAFRQTGIVGIAIPLESGQFRVVRFSLVGGTAVIDRMRDRVMKKQQTSTRGQTL